MSKKVNVLMAAYNGEKYIKAQISLIPMWSFMSGMTVRRMEPLQL